MDKVNIVSNKKRQIVNTGEWLDIYIPMNRKEKKKFSKSLINPCWRIRPDMWIER